MPRAGLEPARLAAADFKSATSTGFVIGALHGGRDYRIGALIDRDGHARHGPQPAESGVEAARGDHDGGLYYYQDLRALLSAVKTADVFGTGSNHHRLAILEVEATGAHVQYGCKFAATRITPIRQIAATI